MREANSSDASALNRWVKATLHQVRVVDGLAVDIREDPVVREGETPVGGARLGSWNRSSLNVRRT